MQTVRSRIPSDLNELDKLNAVHKWIPGRHQVRPTQEQVSAKAYHVQYIRQNFYSEVDYILKTAFGLSSTRIDGLHSVDRDNLGVKKVFVENKFPYQTQGKHYVMWYTYKPDEVQVTKDIEEAILGIVGNESFQFGWYENPKMTIPDIYHVQVFWAVVS